MNINNYSSVIALYLLAYYAKSTSIIKFSKAMDVCNFSERVIMRDFYFQQCCDHVMVIIIMLPFYDHVFLNTYFLCKIKLMNDILFYFTNYYKCNYSLMIMHLKYHNLVIS